MKFVAVLAAATGAAAWANSNVTVTTEVVDQYTTYCPFATQITHGSKTYTVTAPTTLTITDCPCTVTRPVTATTTVSCSTGASNQTWTTVQPTGPAVTGPASVPVGVPTSTPVPTAGAGKVAALSGAGLAGLLGLAAFAL